MTCKLFRYTLTLLLTLMVSGTLTCCFDYDGMVMDGEEDSSEDFGIAFDIALNTIPGDATRAEHPDAHGDEVDNEVDVKGANHDFRILLFDQNDNFLFEPQRVYYQYELEDLDEEYYETASVQTRHWRVVIPASALKRDGVLDKIKANSFKIAVLANWPRSTPLKFEQGDKLYKLSHYNSDNVYADGAHAFCHLPAPKNLMGAYTEWVKNEYSDQSSAELAIRNTERSILYEMPRKLGIGGHIYKRVWRVWNFGSENDLNSISSKSSIVQTWKDKFNTDYPNLIGETWAANENIKDVSNDGFSNYGTFYEDDGLTFENIKTENGITNAFIKDEGIRIAQGLTENQYNEKDEDGKTTKICYIENNRLKFTAFSQGSLKITAKKISTECTLGIQTKENNTTNNKTNRKKETLTDDYRTYTFSNIAVTGAGSSAADANYTIPEVVSIFAVKGSMIVKQIEFIEDKHLYDTDREGYLPGEKDGQLIPMYGIQEFEPIGNYLIPGQIFNMSTASTGTSDTYNRKKIHLLRSLAKVELLIPKGLNLPDLTHAYMRSLNRSSRCEPVDVSKPTNELWNSIDAEISNIKNHDCFYDDTKKYESTDTTENGKRYVDYREKLSWYYKAWTEWKYKETDGGYSGWDWNDKTFTVSTGSDYPHIFNSRINRSDYAHFIYKGERNGHDYYVLYMPEKNVDDPSTAGNISSTPKVPHIELRFSRINEDENLDDNDCYRIYFTDQNEKIPSRDTKYDGIEQKILKKDETYSDVTLYPIVRNHIYRFTVTSFSGADTPTLGSLKVSLDVVPYEATELNPSFGKEKHDPETDVGPYDDTTLNPDFGGHQDDD